MYTNASKLIMPLMGHSSMSMLHPKQSCPRLGRPKGGITTFWPVGGNIKGLL